MAKSLVIVESPAKAKTIGKILGKDFVVKASAGHIRDLPKKGLGVEVRRKTFLPEYVIMDDKEKVVRELQEAAQGVREVYLAPDPDREGEAIAWHLSEILKSDSGTQGIPIHRIEFNEITTEAIRRAVKNPRQIDLHRVDAQQARRVLDRLVGYKISPLLWQKVQRGLSAGRVQSVAVRLICDREREIRAFQPVEYWTLTAKLGKGKTAFEAELVRWKGEKPVIGDGATAEAIVAAVRPGPFTVTKIVTKPSSRKPAAPFTTSTLQQEASRRLGFTVKRTMTLAQGLYEGVELGSEGPVGLITYMRTDSVRIANEAQAEAREFITSTYGADHLPTKPRAYTSRKSAQEAHEAIRPTSILRRPESLKGILTPDQLKLYKLIWERFCASQMSDAKLETLSVDIVSGEGTFRATDTKVVFAGYQAAYKDTAEEDAVAEKLVKLPTLAEGEVLACTALDPVQHFTQPPPRFTEATLVRTLEEQGIGRPSTYAATITTIQDRKYVEREGKALHPTDLGFRVNDQLVAHFPDIVDVTFTSRMEQDLDAVEEGDREWIALIRDFYEPFLATLKKAEKEMEAVAVPSGETCPNCGKQMLIKSTWKGSFLGCEGYPECKTTAPIIKRTGIRCKREGCTGEVIERTSRMGKVFYGCDTYPACNWVSWGEPYDLPCPKCGATWMIKKFPRAKGRRPFLQCAIAECKHIVNMPTARKKGEDAAEDGTEAPAEA
ncbi:MAG: type I DNA topoisomerase [Candidatus Sericytochromatia bacterium]|nr:type I DNA topoisomerase [Candidatus Sericytochromatia bacterium]